MPKDFVLKKDTEFAKVWVKIGSEMNDQQPIYGALHYFPNCNNPELILQLLREGRAEWDALIDKYEKLDEYCNDNTQVFRVLQKSILNSTQREFVEKKVWFRGVDPDSDPESQDNECIYLWTSSTPDELYPMNKAYIRGDTILGIARIGKR